MGKGAPGDMTHDEAKVTPVRGIRVGFDIRWTDDPTKAGCVVYRDHPSATHWTETKRGELILRNRKNKRIAMYRQFVWREVI